MNYIIIKYLSALSIFLFFACNSYSQEIKLFKKTDYNSEYTLSKTKTFSDTLSLQNFLESIIVDDYADGYISAGYDSIVYDTLKNIKAFYCLGSKYKWKNIDFSEVSDIKRFNTSRLKATKPIDIYNLNSVFNSILKHYANSGYPFSSIKLDSIHISEDNNISAKINIDKGNKVIFDSIIIKGDAKIKQYYIEKYLNIKKGDLFSLKKTESINNNIKNIPFLSQIRHFELAFTEDKADILLYMQNRKANQFTGLLGILPNNQVTGKLLITGDVNLYLLNNLGFGELFSVQWQKYEALSQTLKMEISVPYLFKSDFGVGVLFDIEKKDSSYLNTDFTGKILYGSNTGIGFDVFYRNVTSFILTKADSENNFNAYSTNLVGIGYRFSNLNNIYNPRTGILLATSLGFGTKTYSDEFDGESGSKKPIFQNKTSVDITGFIPIWKEMTIKLRSFSAITYSKIIFNNELDFIGGLKTIRGFDELSIPASSYSLLNFEFRYIFEEESALFAFYDLGYFERRFTSNDSKNYAMGIGVGLDLKTSAGIFSIVYAIGKQNNNNFQFNNSKIHFGYKNYF